jgi:hypothetical protein
MTFPDVWTRPLPADGEDSIVMSRRAAYFDLLLERVRSDLAGRDVGPIQVIPTGAVFYEIHQRLEAGALSVAGLDDYTDLFRDRIHASHDFGRYIAALTSWSVLHRKDPRGITKPDQWFDDPDFHAAITPEARAALQSVVWDVVSRDASITGIPEPGTAALAVGAVALGLLRRTRRTRRTRRNVC